METSPQTLLRILVPRLPLIFKTSLLNAISWSPSSSKQDMMTEITVAVLRSIVRVRRPLATVQKFSVEDPGVKGPICISKVTIPAPNDEAGPLDAICQAIKELGDGTETYTVPDIAAIEAEWTGYAQNVAAGAPRPEMSEAEHYKRVMNTVTTPVTILYLHGGAYFAMDPASVRDPVSRLAQLSGGRAYSVRYRLAPQYPFPAQLLDALIAYLSLLSPPPGAFHEPVSAKHIIIAGDSAGGNLSVALTLLILTLRRMNITSCKFHGRDVEIEVPAGVTLNSPWVDMTRSSPSIYANAHFDFLDPPSAVIPEPFPEDIWPTSPPRSDIFCNASMLMHPLTSPLIAPVELWKDMPPTWMCVGSEGLEDEICLIAQRMHQGGGTVQLVGYEGMPHCFAPIFLAYESSKDCFRRWTEFMKLATGVSQGGLSSYATWMKAFSKPLKFVDVPMQELSKLKEEEVLAAMKKVKSNAMAREEEALRKWASQNLKAKL